MVSGGWCLSTIIRCRAPADKVMFATSWVYASTTLSYLQIKQQAAKAAS